MTRRSVAGAMVAIAMIANGPGTPGARAGQAQSTPAPGRTSAPAPDRVAAGPGPIAAVMSDTLTSAPSTPTTPFRPAARLPTTVAGDLVLAGAGASDDRAYGARADGAIALPITRAFALEAHTGLLAHDRADAATGWTTRTGLRLSRERERGGVWAGAAYERSVTRGDPPSAPLWEVGGRATPGNLAMGFSLTQTIERARTTRVMTQRVPPDSSVSWIETGGQHLRATSAVVSARWERRRVGIASIAGVTMAREAGPRRWIQSSFEVAVRPRLAAFATVGDPAPRWLALDPGLGRRASVGLKLTSTANAAAEEDRRARSKARTFDLRALGDGWYVIAIHAESARTVEVMGDFSAWQPRELLHVHGSRFGARVRLTPGVHQIQVRVDGGPWAPPDGMSAGDDGFSGAVGVFVAR